MIHISATTLFLIILMSIVLGFLLDVAREVRRIRAQRQERARLERRIDDLMEVRE